MLGSSNSISCANIMLNSAVADSLMRFASRLEQAPAFEEELTALIREMLIKHERIIFNGNGYDTSWLEEAKKRGLVNYKTTPEAIIHLTDKKNVEMLTSLNIYLEKELVSREEITLENYTKTVLIEASTMLDITREMIIPAVEEYEMEMMKLLLMKKDAGMQNKTETENATILSSLADQMYALSETLEKKISMIRAIEDVEKASFTVAEELIPIMEELRKAADESEKRTSKKYWPMPSYADLLFSVR